MILVKNRGRPKSENLARQTAESLIETYGLDGFRLLIKLFKEDESCQTIGVAFGYTKQRINQIRFLLGDRKVSYNLKPEIEELL